MFMVITFMALKRMALPAGRYSEGVKNRGTTTSFIVADVLFLQV